MNSLKKLASNKIKEVQEAAEEFNWSNYRENLNNLSDEIQEQRLWIMELEESNGAITQENMWLKEEVDKLKVQIMELETLIYGEKTRYDNIYTTLFIIA